MGEALPRRILLVQDDDSMRTALQRMLNAHAFTCDAYASAEALLEFGSAEGATCVVTDLMLPAMSGLELTETLRARGGWPPLILITAHDKPGLEAEARRRGAAGYLPKPFRGTVLVDAINAVTGPAGAQH